MSLLHWWSGSCSIVVLISNSRFLVIYFFTFQSRQLGWHCKDSCYPSVWLGIDLRYQIFSFVFFLLEKLISAFRFIAVIPLLLLRE